MPSKRSRNAHPTVPHIFPAAPHLRVLQSDLGSMSTDYSVPSEPPQTFPYPAPTLVCCSRTWATSQSDVHPQCSFNCPSNHPSCRSTHHLFIAVRPGQHLQRDPQPAGAEHQHERAPQEQAHRAGVCVCVCCYSQSHLEWVMKARHQHERAPQEQAHRAGVCCAQLGMADLPCWAALAMQLWRAWWV